MLPAALLRLLLGDEVLLTLQRLEEVMLAVVAQNVIVIAGAVRIHGGTDGHHAGIGDGSGGQALILIGVIGRVCGLIVVLGDGAAQRIDQRGIDAQQAHRLSAGVGEAVIDDGGNVGLVCAVGLLLDHGGNDDDIPDGVSLLLRRRPHLVVEPPVKVDQHLVDGGLGVLAQIKLVGVREEVALQSVRAAQRDLLEEGEIIIVGGGHIVELGHGGYAVFLQPPEDLGHGKALGDGDRHLLPVGRLGAQVGDDGPVVHIGIELVGPRSNLIRGVGKDRIEVEHRLEFNEAVFLQVVTTSLKVSPSATVMMAERSSLLSASTSLAATQPTAASSVEMPMTKATYSRVPPALPRLRRFFRGVLPTARSLGCSCRRPAGLLSSYAI